MSLISICRGDFRISSYWLALTRNFKVHHQAFIFGFFKIYFFKEVLYYNTMK